MSIIIKKDGKFYRQTIEENEVYLESLEENLLDIRRRKGEHIVKLTKDFDDQIDEIQNEIKQIKSL